MLEEINRVAERIATLPGARTDLHTFPSGAVSLGVSKDGRFFVLDWLPSYQKFGVDEVKEDEGFLISYRYVYTELAPALQRLWDLVAEVHNNGAATLPAQTTEAS